MSASRHGRGSVRLQSSFPSTSLPAGMLRRRWNSLRRAAAEAVAELSVDATSGVVVERLEERRMFNYIPPSCFGGGGTYFAVADPSAQDTADPVRYFDGQSIINSTDLSSNGFGMPWGQTRSFSDATPAAGSNPVGPGVNGNNWGINQLPYLQAQQQMFPYKAASGGGGSGSTDTVVAVGGEGGASGGAVMALPVAFNMGGSGPAPWIPHQRDHLTYSFGGTSAIWTDGLGNRTDFVIEGTRLVFDKYTDTGGNVTSVYGSRTVAGNPVNVRRSSGSTIEQWHYDYFTSGTLTGMLQDVKLQRSTDSGSTFTTQRQVVYDYYTDATTQPGSLDDLKSVIVEDGSGNAINHTVYRYYTNNTNSGAINFQNGSGYTGGIKYIVNGQSYVKAVADGFDPTTASDSDVKKYADVYLEYDSSHRVTLETVHSLGSSNLSDDNRGTFQYEYFVNASTNAATTPNGWTDETKETLPDGSFNYVFMNSIGETLLDLHTASDGSGQTASFFNYDANARRTLAAQPSALLLPPNAAATLAQYDDLLHNIGTGGTTDYQYLSNHTGLIERTEYYTTTTATSTSAGSATGFVHDTYLQQGEMGTAVPQEAFTYFARAGTNATVYPVATDTVYSDTSGAVGRTTTYSYTFFDSATTVRPQTVTTTFPTISVAHNGQGTSVTVTLVDTFDVYGRNTQTVDGDGFTTKNTYDVATGGVTKDEQDAGSGGLDLTTNYTVDGLGRTTELTDPNGNVTYYTYDDVAHESRVYPGWHSYTSGTNTLYTTTGPVQIVKTYQPVSSGEALFNETLTATISGQSASVPTGHEAITSIQTLHRNLTNISGQVIEARDYFSLSGTSYAAVTLGTASNDSSTGNYHVTTYHYNDQGKLDGIEAPTGTIERMVYDSLNRLTSTWVGTDDGSSNTANFDPASPGNMVDVADYTYDLSRRQLNAPTSAPSLSQVSGTSGAATTYYVEVTYVGAHGESLASAESSYTITGGSGLLVVAHPSSVTGATGYNVYVSSTESGGSGLEQKQNGDTPVSISSDWTEPSTGLVGGDAPPVQDNGGDSNLSEETRHPQPGTTSADRVTDNYYDWRDRLVETKSGVQSSESDGAHRPIFYTTYDNLNEVTQVAKYDGDGVAITTTAGVPDVPSNSLLRAKTATSYNEWGQVYRTDKYDIIQTGTNAGTLATTNTLSSQSFYDHRGNVIANVQPGGLVGKYVYDGAGRLTKQYLSDGGILANPSTWNNYSNAASVSNDIVLQQTENTYDANSNVIAITTRQRFHNDATSGAGLGSLMDPSNNPKARATYRAFYYDAANRLTDLVDVGTNGTNGAYTRPGGAPTNSSSILHLTHIDYNDAGWADTTTDPRGIKGKTVFDMLGRSTRTIAAWDGTTPSSVTTGSASNQVTDYTYDGDNHVLTQRAWVNNSGTNNVFQTTAYIYGVTTSNSGLNSNDILSSVEYPNTSTGNPGTTSAYIESYNYDALGELTKKTQRTGSVHQYSYDALGRMTSDNVITLGGGVNGSIRRLDYAVDTGGRLSTATSYAGTTTATIVNQVMRLYNGLGQLTQEYQSHTGAVVTSGTAATPSVQYTYSEMSGGANNSRLTGIVYPTGGRTVTYDYSGHSGLDNVISRLSKLTQTLGSGTNAVTTTLETYDYLGLNTVVRVGHPQTGVDLTYIQQSGDANAVNDAGDIYTGLDRFGRVSDQNYLNTNSGTSLTSTDRFQYGYDANSNIMYKSNLVSSSNSELYHANGTNAGYDSLNRLTDFRRGTLSAGNSTVSSASTTRNWTLDAQGNWSADAAGNTLTVNAQNQYATLTGSSGCCCCSSSSTQNFSYDSNGNMICRPTFGTGASIADGFTYDAWDRETQFTRTYLGSDGYIVEGANNIDALGRRMQVVTTAIGNIGAAAPVPSDDLYYSTGGQVLEDDNTLTQFSSGGSVLSTTYTQMQFVWSPTYINDLALRDRATAGNGNFNERVYVQHDANHNVTAITNASSGTSLAVLERFVYDPYGAPTVLSSSWGSTTDSYNWQYLFQGGRYDQISGLYSFQAREYDSTLGRWIQQEPFGTAYIDGANLNQFVRGNPVRYVDPSGFKYDPYFDAADQYARANPLAAHGYNGINQFNTEGDNVHAINQHIAEVKQEAKNAVSGFLEGRYSPCANTPGGGFGRLLSYFVPGYNIFASARDTTHNLTHWKWTWQHVAQTAFEAIPAAGAAEAAGSAAADAGAAGTGAADGAGAGAADGAGAGAADGAGAGAADGAVAGATDGAGAGTADGAGTGATDSAGAEPGQATESSNSGCFCAGTQVLCSAGLQSIEGIGIGRRVLSSRSDESGPSIDPATHRVIRLSFVKDGQDLLLSFLRPLSVVEGLSAGDTMDIKVLELAVRGRARVLAVEACPPIEEGLGNVVTGAFRSVSVDVYLLKLQGLDAPIEVTGNHPIFSEDQRDFMPTSHLRRGERLRTRDGVAIVESVEHKYGPWNVFNLEIAGAHRYYVTERHVLVHNGNGVADGEGGAGGIHDSNLPELDPNSGRLHGDIPDANQLTPEQAQQQLDKVEQSIDMREWNNDEPLDAGHQQRLDLERQYLKDLQKRLG